MPRKKVPLFQGMDDPAEHTESIQKEYGEHTKSIRPDYKKFAPTDLKPVTIRLTDADKARAAAYFKRRGLTLSQGIRQLLLDFLERG